MNKTSQQFFALLRAGLWESPVATDLFSGTVDWDSILDMAQKQTVTGIVFDGIAGLPTDLQPPAILMRKLYQTVLRIEQSHGLLNQCLADIVPKMQAAGISPILLKGQGVAQNYPNPVRRQCGDIDLFIGRENCEKATQVLLDLGAEAKNKNRSPKHEEFRLGNVLIELHFLVEKLRNPTYNKRFQPWVKQHFEEGKPRQCRINGVDVTLPPINFDALYIFNHAFHHFMSGGVGLRQLCDWALYLHTFDKEIDRDELLENLKSFGILKAWQVFGCLVTERIGLPKSEFPFYTSRYEKQYHRVLDNILLVGNFGFHAPRQAKKPSGYLAGKLSSLYAKQKWLISLLPVFRKEVFSFYSWYWSNGLNNIRKGW